MDQAALALTLFDPQDDDPFGELAHWTKAIHASAKFIPNKILVAARCDRGGVSVSKKKITNYCEESGFSAFVITDAKSGRGADELKVAISQNLPWDRLPWVSTTVLFRKMKATIVRLAQPTKGGDQPNLLMRISELRQRMHIASPELHFSESELRTVVALLAGQAIVTTIDFGDFILLQPEIMNAYASAIVRAARQHLDEIGCVREFDVLKGNIDFKDMPRLPVVDEEILLRAIVQTFLDRSLCLRQETPAGEQLVFPSYFSRDKPEQPEHPSVLVTYTFSGALDEIYSTLVVRLNYTDPFELTELWRNAADFVTPEGRRVGLKMQKKADSKAEITVYFEPGVPADTQVAFIKYIHAHLLRRATDVVRNRRYICPSCTEPVESTRAIKTRLDRGSTEIPCAYCDEKIPLVDLIEEKFGSTEVLNAVQELDRQASLKLDNESLELILVGHAFAIAGEAGQIFRPTPNSDWGIDGEIEFKDSLARASGRRIYLQLKSGDSYLYERQSDGKEIFRIRNPRHAEYWQAQAYPVMLVIRTSDGRIRWMNVTEYLRRFKGKASSQVVFDGEPFTALNLIAIRDRVVEQITHE